MATELKLPSTPSNDGETNTLVASIVRKLSPYREASVTVLARQLSAQLHGYEIKRAVELLQPILLQLRPTKPGKTKRLVEWATPDDTKPPPLLLPSNVLPS